MDNMTDNEMLNGIEEPPIDEEDALLDSPFTGADLGTDLGNIFDMSPSADDPSATSGNESSSAANSAITHQTDNLKTPSPKHSRRNSEASFASSSGASSPLTNGKGTFSPDHSLVGRSRKKRVDMMRHEEEEEWRDERKDLRHRKQTLLQM